MSDEQKQEERPDVEAVIREIREDVDAAVRAAPSAPTEAPAGLRENLAAANQDCLVGRTDGGGVREFMQKGTYIPLRKLLLEVNQFNADVVRTLNDIVRVLEGKDSSVGSELLDMQKERVDLLRMLSERVLKLEKEVDELRKGCGS